MVTVGISLAIAIPSIIIAMAIGPMAEFTKKIGRILGHWGIEVLWRVLIIIIVLIGIALGIALIPIAIGLIIAAGGIALAAFVSYIVAVIIFYICRWIWKCTPRHRRHEAQKQRERLDPEVAARSEEPQNEVHNDNRNGEGEESKVDEKGTSSEGEVVRELL